MSDATVHARAFGQLDDGGWTIATTWVVQGWLPLP